MTVSGQIDPANFYYVVINANANGAAGQPGPVPVISAPWGNGFVAGTATHFIEFNGALPGDGYAVYGFVPGTNLQQFAALSAPIQDTPPGGSSTLEFRIPLSELATSAVPTASIQSLQINFINTNFIDVNPNDVTPPSPKYFDALGNTLVQSQINDYISLPTAQDATYDDAVIQDEAEGDTVQAVGGGVSVPSEQPNLDIKDWSVQITD